MAGRGTIIEPGWLFQANLGLVGPFESTAPAATEGPYQSVRNEANCLRHGML